MTFTLFIGLLVGLSVVVSKATDAVKKLLDECGARYASNFVVLIVSIIVGGLGTTIAYVLLGISFTVVNIICIGLMMFSVWMGAMLGYDKVLQMVEQFKNLR